MNIEQEHIIGCPYCGENIHIIIDCSYEKQEYIEDCQVCCKPITFQVSCGNGNLAQVVVLHENE